MLLSLSALLTGCASWFDSTTPELDGRFGQALQQAKQAQSLPPTPLPDAAAAAEGVGQATANEVSTGLQAQQRGRSAPPAFSTAR